MSVLICFPVSCSNWFCSGQSLRKYSILCVMMDRDEDEVDFVGILGDLEFGK